MCSGPRIGAVARVYADSGSVGVIARACLDLGVGIAQLGQIRRARPGVELGQESVVARARLGLVDRAAGIVQVAEHDRPGRTGRLTGRHHLVAPHRPILDVGGDARGVDALHAVRALFHDPAVPHRHLGVSHQFQAGRRLVGVMQKIEPAHLVRAVVRAVPRADAPVVGHLVQALGAMGGRPDRADDLARGLLALHARHGLKIDLGVAGVFALEIAIDANPVHLARGEHLVAAHDRDVVLGLAGHDARIAADARIQVDRHAPRVSLPLLASFLRLGIVDTESGRVPVRARPPGRSAGSCGNLPGCSRGSGRGLPC